MELHSRSKSSKKPKKETVINTNKSHENPETCTKKNVLIWLEVYLYFCMISYTSMEQTSISLSSKEALLHSVTMKAEIL
jgi:hypothetical protein